MRMLKQVHDPLPPLPAHLPLHLRAAVEAALEKTPEKRPPTVGDFKLMLRARAHRDTAPPRRPSAVRRRYRHPTIAELQASMKVSTYDSTELYMPAVKVAHDGPVWSEPLRDEDVREETPSGAWRLQQRRRRGAAVAALVVALLLGGVVWINAVRQPVTSAMSAFVAPAESPETLSPLAPVTAPAADRPTGR